MFDWVYNLIKLFLTWNLWITLKAGIMLEEYLTQTAWLWKQLKLSGQRVQVFSSCRSRLSTRIQIVHTFECVAIFSTLFWIKLSRSCLLPINLQTFKKLRINSSEKIFRWCIYLNNHQHFRGEGSDNLLFNLFWCRIFIKWKFPLNFIMNRIIHDFNLIQRKVSFLINRNCLRITLGYLLNLNQLLKRNCIILYLPWDQGLQFKIWVEFLE